MNGQIADRIAVRLRDEVCSGASQDADGPDYSTHRMVDGLFELATSSLDKVQGPGPVKEEDIEDL